MNNSLSYNKIFAPLQLRNITLKNRLIRSATYEGFADSQGFPSLELLNIYKRLARPLICEPDFPNKIKESKHVHSRCTNCNLCTIFCDSKNVLRCYNLTSRERKE